MGHWRCLECEIKTGDVKFHDELHKKYSQPHEPRWEHCTCGSGGHPRKCELHPWRYRMHCDELDLEGNLEVAKEKNDVMIEALNSIVELLVNNSSKDAINLAKLTLKKIEDL